MSNQDICFVGFDTSNYTTSIAVCDRKGTVIANLKSPLPVREGERGLRQSDAVFAHTKNLPELCEKVQRFTEQKNIVAVGVSTAPRDLPDSYMPCFLAGKSAATAYAAALGSRPFCFSHQSGHIRAAVYASGRETELLDRPFLAFHVSGGTTEVLSVLPNADGFSVKRIGETADINAGQAIDRIGVRMGLSFPCGKALEEIANTCTVTPPKPHIHVDSCCCNLSGLENLAEKLWNDTHDRALVAAYTLDFIGQTLHVMSEQAIAACGEMPILYAGGVMSNMRIRSLFARDFDACFADPAFAADNAAGIALLCRDAYNRQN